MSACHIIALAIAVLYVIYLKNAIYPNHEWEDEPLVYVAALRENSEKILRYSHQAMKDIQERTNEASTILDNVITSTDFVCTGDCGFNGELQRCYDLDPGDERDLEHLNELISVWSQTELVTQRQIDMCVMVDDRAISQSDWVNSFKSLQEESRIYQQSRKLLLTEWTASKMSEWTANNTLKRWSRNGTLISMF